MTRIAMFHPAFGVPGGAEFLCIEEALYLRGAGEEVSLVTMEFDPERWNHRIQGLPVRVAPKRKWTDIFGGLTKMAKLRTRGRRAAGLMRDFEVIVAHNHPCNAMLGVSDIPGRKVWQCTKPPRGLHPREANPRLTGQLEAKGGPGEDASTRLWAKILEDHKRDEARGSSRIIRTRFDIEQTAKLDHIYAISEFSRDNARMIYGRCGEEVVYPIVRVPEGGHARAGLDRSGLQVLVHSRQEILKNIDTVIRGFARFQAKHPGAHLHLVGEGPARPDLEELAARLIPTGSCTFHGYLSTEKLKEVYDRCDVFALLTLDEPFGMVYPEAAAKGLLMIGPDHGGPFEILEGGKLGWCVDPFDPAALTQALEEVWALPDAEVGRRREEADRVCRARFSEAVIGPQLRRVILEGQC